MQQITGSSCFPAGYIRNVPVKGARGTEFEDGIRTGPSFPDSTRFQDMGPGLLQAPLYLFSVNQPYGAGSGALNAPAPASLYVLPVPADIPANTRTALALATGAAAEPNVGIVPVETPLRPGTMVQGYDFGAPGRCLSYSVSFPAAGALPEVYITAVGYDVYGQRMIETATLVSPPAAGVVTWRFGKAFSIVTECSATAPAVIPAGTVVTVSMSNVFGLPYWIQDASQVLTSGIVGNVTAGLPSVQIPVVGGNDMRGSVEIVSANPPATLAAMVNQSITGSVVVALTGFDTRLAGWNRNASFAGYATLAGVTMPVSQAPVMQYIPRALYMTPGFPNFDAVFAPSGQIQKGPSGLMPVLPNTVTQFGAEQFWDDTLAATLPV